jgi:hypothetical protein
MKMRNTSEHSPPVRTTPRLDRQVLTITMHSFGAFNCLAHSSGTHFLASSIPSLDLSLAL